MLRRIESEERRSRLRPRGHSAFATVAALPGPGRPVVVPGTNVYIRDGAGTLPGAVAALLDRAPLFHSAVRLAELAAGVANADPALGSWTGLRDHHAALFAAIPGSRFLTPDAQTWAEAGIVAGTLARVQGVQRRQREECLATPRSS